jgi:hypothetical protein
LFLAFYEALIKGQPLELGPCVHSARGIGQPGEVQVQAVSGVNIPDKDGVSLFGHKLYGGTSDVYLKVNDNPKSVFLFFGQRAFCF